MNDEMFKAWRESQGQPVDALPRPKGNAMSKTDEPLPTDEVFILKRYPDHQAKYEREVAALNDDDRRLACLLSAIERDRSAKLRAKPIPIYEEMAFALKSPELRRALISALDRRAPAQPVVKALREAIEFADQDAQALTPVGKAMVDRWRAAIHTDLPNYAGWRSIDTAPEDCRVILASAGNWVGEAIMLRDEDSGEQVWTWVDTGTVCRYSLYGWMHLPSPLSSPVLSDLRPDGNEIAAEMDRRGNVIEQLEARLVHIDGIYKGAIDNLNHHQTQLDMDGVMVGVSRQALSEVLAGLEAALVSAPADPAPAPADDEIAAYWKGAYDRMVARNCRLNDALRTIRDQHITDQPASYGGSEYDWVVRQYANLRRIAKEASEG